MSAPVVSMLPNSPRGQKSTTTEGTQRLLVEFAGISAKQKILFRHEKRYASERVLNAVICLGETLDLENRAFS